MRGAASLHLAFDKGNPESSYPKLIQPYFSALWSAVAFALHQTCLGHRNYEVALAQRRRPLILRTLFQTDITSQNWRRHPAG
jgi:hypothetical protein